MAAAPSSAPRTPGRTAARTPPGSRLAVGECLALSADVHLNVLNKSYDRMYL